MPEFHGKALVVNARGKPTFPDYKGSTWTQESGMFIKVLGKTRLPLESANGSGGSIPLAAKTLNPRGGSLT
jgi:hypothetical protein